QFRVRVEWQMGAVNGKIIFEQQSEQRVVRARPRLARVPKQAVVHDEQVGPRGDGQPDGGQAGVHGGGDARDGTAIFHLQPVERAVVVLDIGGAQRAVAIEDDLSK